MLLESLSHTARWPKRRMTIIGAGSIGTLSACGCTRVSPRSFSFFANSGYVGAPFRNRLMRSLDYSRSCPNGYQVLGLESIITGQDFKRFGIVGEVLSVHDRIAAGRLAPRNEPRRQGSG